MISLEPVLDAGKRTYTIVFSSNAPNPGNFDGTESAALVADANQEIWVYRLPAIDDLVDLSSGDDLPLTDLSLGTFTQITNTTASRPVIIDRNPADAIDDNREATISDDGTTLAFISTRNLVTAVGNTDFNPELFLCRTTNKFVSDSNTFVQATSTADVTVGVKVFARFQQNPSLSFNGNVVAFLSTADLASSNNDDGAGHGNAEVYAADFNGSGLTNIRQITKTKADTGLNAGVTLNLLSPGRRMSRDGKFIGYDSRAEDPSANSGTNSPFLAPFVSDIPTTAATNSSPKLIGPRAPLTSQIGDVINFPAFTDYDSSLSPHTVVYASGLNFKPDGTFPTEAEDSTTGLNPVPSGTLRPNQIYSTQVPITASNTFTRLTKNPITGLVSGIRPLTSNTRKRIAFSMGGAELGGGNGVGDFSSELFYLLTLPVTSESSAALSFFTGASLMGPMASAAPTASPSPTPTPSPSPGDPAGLAPGELSLVKSTVALASADKNSVGGAETGRSPILPVELNGVSVSVNGAAAGLYFVGDSPAEGISFVMPIGLAPGTATIAINDQRNPLVNGGTQFRGFVQIVAAQPDIFTSTNGPLGRAVICNVTNPMIGPCVAEPFSVTSVDGAGATVPTILEIHLTGVRGSIASEAKVKIGTIEINATSVAVNTNMYGFDFIRVTLPAELAGAGDVPVIVTITKSTTNVFSSRAADTAAHVTISP
jgi:hypothetical protein